MGYNKVKKKKKNMYEDITYNLDSLNHFHLVKEKSFSVIDAYKTLITMDEYLQFILTIEDESS